MGGPIVTQPPKAQGQPPWAVLAYWPTGLARPLATAATLLRYAMGEGAVAAAGPRPDLVGRVLPVSVLTPHDRGVSPDVVLRVGEPSTQRMAALEVVLVPGATERVLLEGYTLQPMGEGPLLAFPARWAPALEALFTGGNQAVDEPRSMATMSCSKWHLGLIEPANQLHKRRTRDESQQ